MADDYIVKPVFKALQVLRCLQDERRELALSEIAQRLGLPKTTVFRYLQTLCACEYVVHDPATDLYRSALLVQLPRHSELTAARLREAALPQMRLLRDQFNETVNLGLLNGRELLYLEIVESRRSARTRAQLGGHDPLYSTALGKAMLAFVDETCWAQHLPETLARRTEHTRTSLAALRQDIATVRSQGFAQDRGENEEGAGCIGAPIFDRRRQVIAAISLSAPQERLTPQLERSVARRVVCTAQQISEQLKTLA